MEVLTLQEVTSDRKKLEDRDSHTQVKMVFTDKVLSVL